MHRFPTRETDNFLGYLGIGGTRTRWHSDDCNTSAVSIAMDMDRAGDSCDSDQFQGLVKKQFMDIGLKIEDGRTLPMPENLRTSALWIAVSPRRCKLFDSFLYAQMKEKGSVYAGNLLPSAELLAQWPHEIYIGWQNPGTAIWV